MCLCYYWLYEKLISHVIMCFLILKKIGMGVETYICTAYEHFDLLRRQM